eukprot:11255280-Alexandrium_andersonii.AAC.1
MSASLVGSEMCIRDRPTAAEHCEKRRCPFVVAPSSGPPQFRKLVRARRPVSYTHLTLPTICSV